MLADCRRCRTTGPRGFTLVEMLLVVSIIVILISMLLPALGKSRMSTERTRCQSNLRVIGQAMVMYTINHRRVYPPHRHLDLNTRRDWHDLLEPFGNSRDVSHCPAIKTSQVDFGVTWNWKYDAHYIGYGYNGFFLGLYSHPDGTFGHYLTGRIRRWQTTTSVRAPSDLIVVADSHPKSSGGTDHGVSLTIWWPYINNYTEGINNKRHENAGVVSFGDGHAEIIPDVEKMLHPPFDGSNINVEYWDPQRRKS